MPEDPRLPWGDADVAGRGDADDPARPPDEPAGAADEPARAADGPARAADEPARAADDPARAADDAAPRDPSPESRAAEVRAVEERGAPDDREGVGRDASPERAAASVPAADSMTTAETRDTSTAGGAAGPETRAEAPTEAGQRAVAVGPGRHAPGEPEGAAGNTRTEARLAHIHLRTAMHALARAELETLAAHGSLDVPALADLAEVRWRTGDLVGAGEAADAYLEAGGDDLVVLCVAAEAAAAAGRMAAARHLAARVLARGRDRVEDLFAGQPRSNIWPELGSGAQPATAAASPAPARPGPEAASPILAASASSDLADAQARIARGDVGGIATRLALVLRVQPVLAPAVLSVADQALRVSGAGSETASLHLVRGDAYRLMGRETLASEAFQQSSRTLRSAQRSDRAS